MRTPRHISAMNYFYYGDDALGSGPGTRVYEDSRAIEDVFGKSNVIIAMVPNGNVIKEATNIY